MKEMRIGEKMKIRVYDRYHEEWIVHEGNMSVIIDVLINELEWMGKSVEVYPNWSDEE